MAALGEAAISGGEPPTDDVVIDRRHQTIFSRSGYLQVASRPTLVGRPLGECSYSVMWGAKIAPALI
jgi:hypothetical protein